MPSSACQALRELVMLNFSVRDMRVSSQAEAVLRAVRHVDLHASIHINLFASEVQITPSQANATDLSDAISHAGFHPVLRECGDTVRGLRQTPPKISFESSKHDFSVSAGNAE